MNAQTEYLESIHHWRARFASAGIPLVTLDGVVERLTAWSDWPRLWEQEGDAETSYAEVEWKREHSVTAAECYHRSALYYHFGQFVLFDDDVLRLRLVEKKRTAFRAGVGNISPSARLISFPVAGGQMHGVLRLPEHTGGQSPLVIVLPGADSAKEEYTSFENLMLSRGAATLSVDGPGQGESRWTGLGWRFDYESVFPDLLRGLDGLDGIDTDRLGVVGFSFGGYLSPRVAARCPEIRAAVSLGGCFDLSYWDNLPPLLKEDFRYLFGADDNSAARELALQHVSLNGVIEEIEGELLVVHGSNDRIFKPADAWRMQQLQPRAEVVMYEGGDHCCHNLSHRAKPLIADWLADHFG